MTAARESPARGAKLAYPLLALVLFGGATLVMLHDWLGVGGDPLDNLAGGHIYDIVIVAAGVACLLRAEAVPRERWAWLLFGISILCWGGGEIYWTLFILDNPEPPYPSPADAFYLGFYPLAYAGLALLVRARASELDWRLWTDGLIAALGTAALGTVFVFDFIAERTNGTGLEVATSLAYPLGDIAMLALIVGVIALSGWRPDRTWSLLLVGLAAMGVADMAYSVQSTSGVVPAGNWIDPVYLLSACFLGAVLWLPSAATIERSNHVDDRRALMVPTLFASLMIGLAGMQYVGGTSRLSTVLWAATIAAIVIRLTVSVRENRVLLEQVQTDPLTGLGNRGRMQVDLEKLADRAAAGQPASLVFLDLNGFKHYNDTLGHPAGDALLVRLGRALRDAIGNDGTAYRIGGDEFCVLLTCDSRRFPPVVRRTAEALSENGKGFEVDASFGAVVIPDEAASPSEALRLADVRMYANKESRRTTEAKVGDWPVPAVTSVPDRRHSPAAEVPDPSAAEPRR
jgi:diguanylate cyclase (GGDEF)-like protein